MEHKINKKNFSKISIVMIMLLSLIIAGCSSVNTGGDTRTAGIGEDSSSENGAVEIGFVENNPPSEAFKGVPFDFAFEIFNYQMHDVDDMKLKITGFDRGNVAGLPEEDTVGTILQASEGAGPGFKDDHFYGDVVVDDFTREFPLNPRIRYCYSQTSFRQEGICVPSRNNVCDDSIVVESNVETNGPFGFNVEQVRAINDKIRIDFSMTNRLGGRVVEQCFDREGFASEFSGVSASLGVEEGSCEPTGTDRYLFRNGGANFYCEFSRTGDESYPAQLYVQAGSLYEQEENLNIVVRELS